jgi:hypothetical protein
MANAATPEVIAAAVAFFDTMTATAEEIAAIESQEFISAMIVGLQKALERREEMVSQHYTGTWWEEQYVAEMRAAYSSAIEVYVKALAIARAAQ